MYPSLRPILNKGGAGRYISREESVERLQPIAAAHLDLVYAYDAAAAALDGPARERLDAVLPYLRIETNKVFETILSLGGTAAMGTEREPAGPATGDVGSVVRRLREAETGFGALLRDEADAVHHQERTRAILEHNARASESRLGVLRDIAAELRLV